MSSSALPNRDFRLKVSPTLVSQLAVVGVSADELLEFIATQFKNIVSCKPNCRIYTSTDKPIWIMRGYYPNTPVFFKLSVVKTQQLTNHAGTQYHEDFVYYVRARALEVKSKRKWHDKMRMSHGEIVVYSDEIMKNMDDRFENEVLGANHEIKTILPSAPKKPKCMSPKGCKLFRYKKPSKRGKRET